jgi:hypothetical protein
MRGQMLVFPFARVILCGEIVILVAQLQFRIGSV